MESRKGVRREAVLPGSQDISIVLAKRRIATTAGLSRSPNNSDKSRSADNLTCNRAPAASPSNSGRTVMQHCNLGKPRHWTVSDLQKRLGRMPIQSSMSKLAAEKCPAQLCLAVPLSDLRIVTQLGFMLFNLMTGDGQATAPGIADYPPGAEPTPGPQEFSRVGNGGISQFH